MTGKNDDTSKITDDYINSIVDINRKYGFEEIPPESINKTKTDIEKATRKLQKLLAHP